MKDEKKFLKPELEIINFLDEDIIITSGEGDIDGESVEYPGGIY